jgi:hypothetical protein
VAALARRARPPPRRSFLAKSQSGSNVAALDSALDAFKAKRNLTPRQVVGLESQIDQEYTQEYAARCGAASSALRSKPGCL